MGTSGVGLHLRKMVLRKIRKKTKGGGGLRGGWGIIGSGNVGENENISYLSHQQIIEEKKKRGWIF